MFSQAQPGAFGGFGAAPAASPAPAFSGFGAVAAPAATPQPFGAQPAAGAFGAPQQAQPFGAPAQAQPFGAPQQAQATPFGAALGGGGAFGASPFGATQPAAQPAAQPFALGGGFGAFGASAAGAYNALQVAPPAQAAPKELLTKATATAPARPITHADKWDDLAPETQARLQAIECVPARASPPAARLACRGTF
jgi:hypothetical protein